MQWNRKLTQMYLGVCIVIAYHYTLKEQLHFGVSWNVKINIYITSNKTSILSMVVEKDKALKNYREYKITNDYSHGPCNHSRI